MTTWDMGYTNPGGKKILQLEGKVMLRMLVLVTPQGIGREFLHSGEAAL
jgi:hypothetical protein